MCFNAAVACRELADPANGAVTIPNGMTFTNVATYQCNERHNLEGEETRTCEADGEWSGVEPNCTGTLKDTYLTNPDFAPFRLVNLQITATVHVVERSCTLNLHFVPQMVYSSCITDAFQK